MAIRVPKPKGGCESHNHDATPTSEKSDAATIFHVIGPEAPVHPTFETEMGGATQCLTVTMQVPAHQLSAALPLEFLEDDLSKHETFMLYDQYLSNVLIDKVHKAICKSIQDYVLSLTSGPD